VVINICPTGTLDDGQQLGVQRQSGVAHLLERVAREEDRQAFVGDQAAAFEMLDEDAFGSAFGLAGEERLHAHEGMHARVELLDRDRVAGRLGQAVDVFEFADGQQFALLGAVAAVEGDDGVDARHEGRELVGEDRFDFALQLLGEREPDDARGRVVGQCEQVHFLLPSFLSWASSIPYSLSCTTRAMDRTLLIFRFAISR
jgi:hypothetical protein